ncbi:hypothetical protein ACVWZP_001022 [Pseudomonas sp. TE36184]
MVPRIAQTAVSTPLVRKPTEYLTHVRIEQLSELNFFLLAKEGFALKDVESMISLSELYLSLRVIGQIVGKPGRPTKQKQRIDERST